jgi:hypothetical protein
MPPAAQAAGCSALRNLMRRHRLMCLSRLAQERDISAHVRVLEPRTLRLIILLHAQDSRVRDLSTAGGRMRSVYKAVAGLVIAAGLMLAMPPRVAFAQAVELVVVDVKTVARGYRTSKNEKIGEIDDIIIARDKGLFAILQVGGFLGLGAHLVAVPYQSPHQSLVIDETGRKIQLPGASREALKKLQEFKYAT